jgi:hypothetical protein
VCITFTCIDTTGNKLFRYIATRRGGRDLYKTGFGLDDWIYCTLYMQTVRDYGQYRAIAILRTLEFTVTHALGFPSSLTVSWQQIYHSLSLQLTHLVFLARSNSFLAISSRSPSTAISRTRTQFSTTLIYSPCFLCTLL